MAKVLLRRYRRDVRSPILAGGIFRVQVSSSSRCSGDKSFLLLLMFRALVTLIAVAPAFLVCHSAGLRHMGFFRLVLINSQFPRRSECSRQYILARCRQANMRVS